MSLTLKPHPEYKKSGLSWVGMIPAHWRTERAKWLFSRMQRPVRPQDEVVTCFRDGTVTLRKTRRVDGFTESLKEIGYQGVRRGDLVIHAMDAFAGAIGVADCDGKSTPVYAVCSPKRDADTHYYARVVREMARSQWVLALAKGIRERSTDFRYETFANEWLPTPPVREQVAVAAFARNVETKTAKLIRAKRRTIELLNEQKQAIICRAVTRGLDPTVRLKPSGVEWLGQIPTHWQVLRFARVVRHGPQNGISPAIDENGTIGSFSISAIRAGRVEIRATDTKYVSGSPRLLDGTYSLLKGDILIVRGNGNIRLVGKAGLVEDDLEDRVYPDLLMRLRVTDEVLPQFIVMLLNGPTIRAQVESAARTAVGTFKINNQQVRQLWLALPEMAEQQKIVEWVVQSTVQIDLAAARAARQVELLKEYRTRLIADVVTGKLDVRGVELPDFDAAEDIEAVADEETDVEVEEALVGAEEGADVAN